MHTPSSAFLHLLLSERPAIDFVLERVYLEIKNSPYLRLQIGAKFFAVPP